MRFWKNVRVPFFKNPQKMQKMAFEQIKFCPDPNSHFEPSIKLFYIYGKIDLEKLIMKNPISDFFTETFDLLSAGQFENLVFRPQPQGGQICVSWAHPLGPGLGPPTWAHPRGPSLGPPTWAQTPPPAPAGPSTRVGAFGQESVF